MMLMMICRWKPSSQRRRLVLLLLGGVHVRAQIHRPAYPEGLLLLGGTYPPPDVLPIHHLFQQFQRGLLKR